MKEWAKWNDVQLNRGIYFDQATMDDIICLEFCPGKPTTYLNTVEHGISLLIFWPHSGIETADIWSHKQAIEVPL